MADLSSLWPLNSAVFVLDRYRGDGRFGKDGCEGIWYVAGYAGTDLLLNRSIDGARDGHLGSWDIAISWQRIDGSPAAYWRPDNISR